MPKISERKKLLIYKSLLILFALVLAFMPNSVSRNLEVNSRVVVEMIGIDGSDDGVELTAQYVTPTEQENTTTKDSVTVKAPTVTEAVELVSVALGRRAEFGQCSVVVFGKDLDPHILGTLMTATDVTADVYLTAAVDKASDTVSDITEFMKKSGVTEADFIAYSSKKAHIATTTLLNFLSNLDSASHTAFMPIVEMIKKEGGEQGGSGGGQGGSGSSGEQGGSGDSGSSGGQGGSGGEQEKPSGMKVERLALYSGDRRVGVLEKSAARGVAWISSPVEESIVTADVECGGKTVEDVSAKMHVKHSGVSVNVGNRSAVVKLKVIIEPNGDKFTALDVNSGNSKNAVSDGFKKVIEKEIRAAFDESLALGCDPLFISRKFYRYHPKFYENGFDLANIDVGFAVSVSLK